MKKKTYAVAAAMFLMAAALSACGGGRAAESQAAQTEASTEAEETADASEEVSETEAAEPETQIAPKPTIADVDPAVYKISNGIWYFEGNEAEKSIDMDGLKGATTYTAEAIPEYEGYLNYLGETDDGYPEFDVLDLSGRSFMKLTFTSEDQFYVDDDEAQYYVKWDY